MAKVLVFIIFYNGWNQPLFCFWESAQIATGVLDSRVHVVIYLNYLLNELAILC
jgi:hypothetical protein